uniref:Venom allergen 5 n=1 Tax=Polybia scutellaris rioplatensis TaxID=260979 RepID=VA5_POLSR|nr:RecName: Full=Venom allergen 5; AltName: Full=Allergen Pol s V; AltName: Full=Antigen 5; Short=Ag5; AltName: Full=Cysteine-rich venom protein; Short=CRVP; AltName: Allergen=Pol s 5 [Polybia scutellaris rioplatensis]
NKYCNIKCSKVAHTVCQYGESTKPSSKNCNKVSITSVGVTEEEKKLIVDEHNRFRQKVAQGLETRGNPGPQPAASDMNNLVWNDELAYIAQVWANQCQFFVHDKCRNTAQYQVGQNIAYSASTAAYPGIVSLIVLWENEVKDFNYSQGITKENFAKVGHYTQVVWAKTKEVGCGSIKYIEKGMKSHYLVCNYGPAGNYMGQPIYTKK